MSWGTDAASAAGNTGQAVGTAGEGVNAAGSGTVLADTGTGTSGFSLDSVNNSQSPYIAGESSPMMTAQQVADVKDYGTIEPNWVDKAGSFLERFQKGQGQNVGQAYKSFGNNPETYGYVFGKMSALGGKGGNSPANVTTNINYQQPDNEYLRRRRGY